MKDKSVYSDTYGIRILEPKGNSEVMPEEERCKWERWHEEAPTFAKMFPKMVFLNGQKDEKVVGLTFDDGPDKHYTPLILDVLKQYHIQASFFVHGNRAKRYKDLVKRMADEGHYIGGHTCTHPDLRMLTPEKIMSEIQEGCDVIYKITGQNPEIIRPPYGELDLSVIQTLDRLDKKIMLWSINTYDWLEKTPTPIVNNVINHIRPGDVVLMHSYTNKRPTLEALPKMIEQLQWRGYRFARVDELITV
ncbi:MAG: polysaccharide deacetylase family protein [Cellulosilyticaceae bacterium]